MRCVLAYETGARGQADSKRSCTALLLLGEEGFCPVGAVTVFLGALFGGVGECPEVGELLAVFGAQLVAFGPVVGAGCVEFGTVLLAQRVRSVTAPRSPAPRRGFHVPHE